MSKKDLLGDLNEQIPVQESALYTKKKIKVLLFIAILLTIIGTVLDTYVSHYYYGAGRFRSLAATLLNIIFINLLVVPAIALFLATFLSLIPMNGRKYLKKIVSVWLWITCILSIIQSSLFILALNELINL